MFEDVNPELVELDVLDSLGSEVEFFGGERTLSPETAKILYAPNKKMRGSVTRLETFNKCPFQYFASYGLKLSERREYKVKPPDIGSILHSVMSRFGERLQAENRRWSDLSDAELLSLLDEMVELNLLRSVDGKFEFNRYSFRHMLGTASEVEEKLIAHGASKN